MKILHRNNEIEIIDDNFYVGSSSSFHYQLKYSNGKIFSGRNYAINKRGIIVRNKMNKEVFASALICENGGRTKINEGLFILMSDALFICVGILYDRYHTRNILYYGGLVQVMPLFSVFFLIFTLANLGLPGTINFIGEFLILIGI